MSILPIQVVQSVRHLSWTFPNLSTTDTFDKRAFAGLLVWNDLQKEIMLFDENEAFKHTSKINRFNIFKFK